MLENFFGEEIEKTVFISEEQLADFKSKELIGKYFEDTAIYNVYPDAIAERGEILGYVVSEVTDRW